MHRSLACALAALALLAGGCGGEDDASTATTGAAADPGPRAPSPSLNALEHDAKGIDGMTACRLLRRRDVVGTLDRDGIAGLPRLRREANDSLDLSQCRYSRRAVNVRVVIDAAAQAGRRYFEQQAEYTQKYVGNPRRQPQLVRHVGDDAAWANAGAFWTPSYDQLVAHKQGRIVRINVSVPGTPDAVLKAAAADLGRLIFRRMAERRGT
ncbi:MAG TPA: hypothetical protein VFR97_07520 [Capillimicrobium sp.]|nr:hypothetical protein [Capillimicrobium sp.]